MNWDYVAGLFDGEGCISYQGRVIGLHMDIYFVTAPKILIELQKFFSDQGLTTHIHHFKNPLGESDRLSSQREGITEIIVKQLLPRVIEKKRQLELSLTYFALKKNLKERGEVLLNHLDEFDIIRQEMHALSKKGPRVLKPMKKSLNSEGTE